MCVSLGLAGFLFGSSAFVNSFVSLFLAELLTNGHAFLNIVTNHAGSDLYRFEKHCTPRSSTFYLRAIISSANFWTGSDINDFLHGWLNYQASARDSTLTLLRLLLRMSPRGPREQPSARATS